MEGVAKSYYKAILTDANAMIDKYMSLVKNFPVVFNGSKLKQTIENLMNQLNKVSPALETLVKPSLAPL